jgi:hypothetical protein
MRWMELSMIIIQSLSRMEFTNLQIVELFKRGIAFPKKFRLVESMRLMEHVLLNLTKKKITPAVAESSRSGVRQPQTQVTYTSIADGAYFSILTMRSNKEDISWVLQRSHGDTG